MFLLPVSIFSLAVQPRACVFIHLLLLNDANHVMRACQIVHDEDLPMPDYMMYVLLYVRCAICWCMILWLGVAQVCAGSGQWMLVHPCVFSMKCHDCVNFM